MMLRQSKAEDIGAAGGEVWRSAIEKACVQSSLFRTADGSSKSTKIGFQNRRINLGQTLDVSNRDMLVHHMRGRAGDAELDHRAIGADKPRVPIGVQVAPPLPSGQTKLPDSERPL